MTERKTAASREKELKLAIARIEHGRTQKKGISLSISAVARELGISPALIHNHYPDIAESIRTKVGADSRKQRDAKQDQLKKERKKSAELREDVKSLNNQINKLTTINEMLLLENSELKAKSSGGNVVGISNN
jgi:SMC interacting uncharacterized protein involved in chromosome segregation